MHFISPVLFPPVFADIMTVKCSATAYLCCCEPCPPASLLRERHFGTPALLQAGRWGMKHYRECGKLVCVWVFESLSSARFK